MSKNSNHLILVDTVEGDETTGTEMSFYAACATCGWDGPVQTSIDAAETDVRRHRNGWNG